MLIFSNKYLYVANWASLGEGVLTFKKLLKTLKKQNIMRIMYEKFGIFCVRILVLFS